MVEPTKIPNSQEDMPSISVVIPVFNGEQYIAEAIQSVMNQSFSPLEIIVVDDGATDRTAEIVRGISGPIAIVSYSQHNKGPGAACNLGVSVAKGNWVAFLHSDDIWHPKKLALQIEFLEANPDVTLFYSKVDFIDHSGHRISESVKGHPLASLIFDDEMPVHTSSILVKKFEFERVKGFDSSLRYGEDWELFTRIAGHYKVFCIPQTLAKYRIHATQLCHDKKYLAQNWPPFYQFLWKWCQTDPSKLAKLEEATALIVGDLFLHLLESDQNDVAGKLLSWLSHTWDADFQKQDLLTHRTLDVFGDRLRKLLTLGEYQTVKHLHAGMEEVWKVDARKQDLLTHRTLDVYGGCLLELLALGEYQTVKHLHAGMEEVWREDARKLGRLNNNFANLCAGFVKRFLVNGNYGDARECCRLVFSVQPFSLKNLRRWALSYMPRFRDLYRDKNSRRPSV